MTYDLSTRGSEQQDVAVWDIDVPTSVHDVVPSLQTSSWTFQFSTQTTPTNYSTTHRTSSCCAIPALFFGLSARIASPETAPAKGACQNSVRCRPFLPGLYMRSRCSVVFHSKAWYSMSIVDLGTIGITHETAEHATEAECIFG